MSVDIRFVYKNGKCCKINFKFSNWYGNEVDIPWRTRLEYLNFFENAIEEYNLVLDPVFVQKYLSTGFELTHRFEGVLMSLAIQSPNVIDLDEFDSS